ncbi:MAG TPA: class I SAM-dependent methyltransferase [bacterium]|nr:class I SAM-dependent methyltransferase [bacterium]
MRALSGGETVTVLEAGGWPPKLPDFLPGYDVTVLDKVEAKAPGYVQADAAAMPFPDKHFDAAIGLDTLEHVAPDRRAAFISELARVARSFVIIAAPFRSEAVQSADRAIFEFIRAHAGYEQPFLKEHLGLGLPDLDATRDRMAALGLDLHVLPNGRLDRWLFMMASYYAYDADPDLKDALPELMEAYNRAFYPHDNSGPAYRHFIIGAFQGLGQKRGELAGLAAGPQAPADSRGVTMVMEMARAIAMKRKDREREALLAEVRAREDEVKALQDHVAALQEFERKVKSLPLYSLYEKYFKRRGKP